MVAPAVLAALIGAAGSMGSSMIDKEASGQKGVTNMFQATDPMRYLQGLNSSFTIPGMQSVNNLLQR
jgi:hypothetical protein